MLPFTSKTWDFGIIKRVRVPMKPEIPTSDKRWSTHAREIKKKKPTLVLLVIGCVMKGVDWANLLELAG